MGANHSTSLELDCKTGKVEITGASIQATKEFDVSVFIQETFAFAREVFDADTHLTWEGVRAWTDVPAFPAPDPTVNAPIELVLRECVDSIDSEMAGTMLAYSCCTHIDLVPVILELFKDKLMLDHIMESIYACETRYPDTCWFIMTQCINQLVGKAIGACFNICCEWDNVGMLELLIHHHHARFEVKARKYAGRRLDIDKGILKCCSSTDLEIVSLLARYKFLSCRLLWACAVGKNLPAVELIFAECKEILTAEPIDKTQKKDRMDVYEALQVTASNKDAVMLELFIDEIGDSLTREAKHDAFIQTCVNGDAASGKILLDRCSINLPFDCRPGVPGSITKYQAWTLMAETYGGIKITDNR